MSILPRSLFGRLTLVLLAGLVVAQLFSASILLRDRGQTLYRSVRADLVDRTAGIIRLLDALEPSDRQRLLPLLSTPERRAYIVNRPVDVSQSIAGRDEAAASVERELRYQLQERYEVRVALWDATIEDRVPFSMAEMHRRHMMGREGVTGPWAYFHGVDVSAGGFFIQARLSDGSWVQFERNIPQSLLDQPTRILLTLVTLLLSVVVLALLAVRWVVRPLRALGQAAEGLGRDIERPPLSETGPLEVVETARAFNTMQRRIRSFIEDRARILGAVSHDLKTPLTRLRLRSELLDEDLRNRMQDDLDDMEAMVSATLDFMRGSESHEQTQPLDLMALLESIQDNVSDSGGLVSLSGSVNGPIQARPIALKRCITNLVENGVRYGGEVEIAVEGAEGQVRITVQDHGPGIPEELLGKVFDPFFRIESSRARHTGGTGLGLGIARNLARAHGGDLRLRNRDGGGLIAELTLPK